MIFHQFASQKRETPPYIAFFGVIEDYDSIHSRERYAFRSLRVKNYASSLGEACIFEKLTLKSYICSRRTYRLLKVTKIADEMKPKSERCCR